jgi:hypothetical protein
VESPKDFSIKFSPAEDAHRNIRCEPLLHKGASDELLNNLPLVRREKDQRAQAAFGRHADEPRIETIPSACVYALVSQTLITGGGLHGKGLIYSPRRDVVCAKTCLAVFVHATS